MPRIYENETNKVAIVIKENGDPNLPEGHHSPVYYELDFKENKVEYFYDASDHKCLLKLYSRHDFIEIKENEDK
jgi:hypothetical protein